MPFFLLLSACISLQKFAPTAFLPLGDGSSVLAKREGGVDNVTRILLSASLLYQF